MAKIAVDLERALAHRRETGAPGVAASRVLASGKGWRVADVLCTSGPGDRSFEEQHTDISIAIVAAGTFQYRASIRRAKARRELMTPGSLLLGNLDQSFECGHDHGTGDRCISFWYSPEYFEQLTVDAGVPRGSRDFHLLRLPPLLEMSPLIAHACEGLSGSDMPWEELSLKLAACTLKVANGISQNLNEAPPSTVARITNVLRRIERSPDEGLTLGSLANDAGLSPYHFLRTFEAVAGITPHQYILRSRLREAAIRLTDGPTKVLDIALDSGFGDVSNFNRAFRAEFGVSPRGWRRKSLSNVDCLMSIDKQKPGAINRQ